MHFYTTKRPFCSQCSIFTAPTFAKEIQFKAKKVHFLFLLYQQTKSVVLLSQRLQPKLELYTKCLIFFTVWMQETPFMPNLILKSIVAPALSYMNPFIWDLAKPKLFLFLLHLQVVQNCMCMCCLCKTAYSTKEEYSSQLQTTGLLDVWLWEALPKPTPPLSLVVSQIPTLTWGQITSFTHSTCPSQDLYRCKTRQNLALRLFH